MVNRSKAKGTAAESQVARWLQAHGFPHAERRALAGNSDRGDIAGIPRVSLEVKACKTMTLAAWVDESIAEAVNAGAEVHAVVHKRIGKGDVGDWYATLPVSVLAELLAVYVKETA